MENKELFYELCEKYGVELSDKVDTPKIIIDEKIHEINRDILEELIPKSHK